VILQLVRSRRRQVLVDIDTQRDFLLAEGNACIRNHRRVLAHIRRVIAWARRQNVPIISTCEVYPNGQKKISYTLLNSRIVFPADGNTDLPRDMLRKYRQIVLHKRCVDPFDEPRIDRLLSEVRANEFILIGADVEGAIKATALGLLQRGKRVTVIIDGTTHLRLVGACHCESCKGVTRKAITSNKESEQHQIT
jgi:nicotinamidase-related amidase